MEIRSRFGTASLLGAILGLGGGSAQAAKAASELHAAPRRRRMRARNTSNRSYTKKGPGRRAYPEFVRDPASGAWSRRGKRRYPIAQGPDSLSAYSNAGRMVDAIGWMSDTDPARGAKLAATRSYVSAMRSYGWKTGLLILAIEQLEQVKCA